MRPEIYQRLKTCLETRQLVTLATVVGGSGVGGQLLIWPAGETVGDLGSARLNREAVQYADRLAPTFESARKTLQQDQESVDVFFEVHPPAPELVLVGAVHVAVPLVEIARLLGFRTVVIDPRAAFATQERFPNVDALVCRWPHEALEELGLHESSYLAVLSHDLKIDLPALQTALRSPARYIGALGSRKTHRKRVEALEDQGYTPEQIARIHSPIGLDLGGRRAEEIALAIMAQVVAARHGRATAE